MIEQKGVRVLALAKLVLPGDLRQRCALPHVQEMARGIQMGTYTHLPVARFAAQKWRLIKGADIVAAHVFLRYPTLRVQCVSCSELEAELLALSEAKDTERDETRRAAILAKIDEVKERMTREPAGIPKTRGPRRSPASAAVKEVAALTGVDEQTLMRHYRQQNQREGMPGAEPEPLRPAGPPINALGFELDDEFCGRVAEVQRRLVGALDGLRKAEKALLSIPAAELEMAPGLASRAAALREAVHGAYPASLCPWCKRLPGVTESCASCVGSPGWIGREKLPHVPAKLWDQLDRVVMVQGQPTRVSELIASRGTNERQ